MSGFVEMFDDSNEFLRFFDPMHKPIPTARQKSLFVTGQLVTTTVLLHQDSGERHGVANLCRGLRHSLGGVVSDPNACVLSFLCAKTPKPLTTVRQLVVKRLA